VDPPDFAQGFIGVGVEPRPIAADGVGKKNLSRQARRQDNRFFEEFLPLKKGCTKVHCSNALHAVAPL
jgi:hypothetical protein